MGDTRNDSLKLQKIGDCQVPAVSCLIDGVLEPTAVERMMDSLSFSDVYRAKGMVLISYFLLALTPKITKPAFAIS